MHAHLIATLILTAVTATCMEHNLAAAWNDRPSPPCNPYISFRSPQSEDLLFSSAERIQLVCQANLRSCGLSWSLHRNLVELPFRTGHGEAMPANRFAIAIDTAGLVPGFYDLRVDVDSGMVVADKDVAVRRPAKGICTFGWRVDELTTIQARPGDFAAFWERARREIAAVPLDARVEELQRFDRAAIAAYNLSSACLPADFDPQGHRSESVLSGRVSFAGPGGGRIHGWLARPEGPGPFPAMLVLPGAGIGPRPRPLEHARHGYVALDIHIHGMEVDLPSYPTQDGYYDNVVYEPADAHYFFRVHQRCLQALAYLRSRPDVDQRRIVVVGGSQGGRLTIITAALDGGVAAAVPAIAHFANQPYVRWAMRCNGYAEQWHRERDPSLRKTDGMAETALPLLRGDAVERCLAYYDPMHFAPDMACPVLMNAGLIDPVSSPTGVFSVFNRLPAGLRSMVVLDGLGHDWCPDFDRRAFRWLDHVLAQRG